MIRLISCLFLGALPLSAQASTDLARQWGQEASRLSIETTAMIHAAGDSSRFVASSVEIPDPSTILPWIECESRGTLLPSRWDSCPAMGLGLDRW